MRLGGTIKGGTGEICWLFCWLISCDVHTAGENVNREDNTEESVPEVNSSESENTGESSRVGGKWSGWSGSLFSEDWLSVSLVQGVP